MKGPETQLEHIVYAVHKAVNFMRILRQRVLEGLRMWQLAWPTLNGSIGCSQARDMIVRPQAAAALQLAIQCGRQPLSDGQYAKLGLLADWGTGERLLLR